MKSSTSSALNFKETRDLVNVHTRVILISSVRPELTSAGQIILYRHLVDQPGIELEVYGSEPKRFSPAMVLRRVLGRVAKWGGVFDIAVNCFWVLWEGRWMDADLPKSIDPDVRTIVMTVAQGEGYHAAQRFAKRHNLPLVVFFHDWWPDMAAVHRPFQRQLEKRFRELYQQSQLALCVSEGMCSILGEHPNAHVLYPIPSQVTRLPVLAKSTNTLKVLCFGNLHEYGPMVAEALQEAKGHNRIRMEARGANPNWPDSFRSEMAQEGMWHDFSSRVVLEAWIDSADAFLVPMVFDPSMRRRMETSFPSKMVEMAQYGRPLVIWGPEYCSAIKWARAGNRALCVTDPDPKALLRELEKLDGTPDECRRLSECSRKAATGDFSPAVIQDEFFGAVGDLLRK